jgi:hypothetical protein
LPDPSSLGRLRFGCQDYYKRIEGSRRDDTEGTGTFDWDTRPNPIHYEGSSLNTRFLLCTTHPGADRALLTQRFGANYIVVIKDPNALLERINAAWRDHPLASGRCDLVQVEYNKGALLEPDPYLMPPPGLTHKQKAQSYEMEREFRYVLTCTSGTEPALKNHLCLTLPDCSDICEQIVDAR